MPEIIEIKSPQDWETRPNFRAVLHGSEVDLDRIVGKYDLPRPGAGVPAQTGMVHCGLNGCNTGHFRGFLILLKSGFETIVGRDCGREKMGAVFEEIEAVFVARETLANRQKLLLELQNTRATVIQQANILAPKCKKAHEKIDAIRNEFIGYSAFWRKLEESAKLDGRVVVAAKSSEGPKKGAGVDLVVAATIQKCNLFFADTSVHHRLLRVQVIRWLEIDLDSEIQIAGDNLKRLEALTIKASDLQSILRNAAEFVRDAELLLEPSNLGGFREIVAGQLSSSQKTNAMHRAIKRLLTTT